MGKYAERVRADRKSRDEKIADLTAENIALRETVQGLNEVMWWQLNQIIKLREQNRVDALFTGIKLPIGFHKALGLPDESVPLTEEPLCATRV